MKYNSDTFFHDMLACFNRLDDHRLNKEHRIGALLDAYSILQDMDSKWDKISDQDKGKAHYFWRVYVKPEAEKHRIILDGGEPQYMQKKSSAATRERKL